jgi:hypothetical protein
MTTLLVSGAVAISGAFIGAAFTYAYAVIYFSQQRPRTKMFLNCRWGQDGGWEVGGFVFSTLIGFLIAGDLSHALIFSQEVQKPFSALVYTALSHRAVYWLWGMLCVGLGVAYQSFTEENTDIRPRVRHILFHAAAALPAVL